MKKILIVAFSAAVIPLLSLIPLQAMAAQPASTSPAALPSTWQGAVSAGYLTEVSGSTAGVSTYVAGPNALSKAEEVSLVQGLQANSISADLRARPHIGVSPYSDYTPTASGYENMKGSDTSGSASANVDCGFWTCGITGSATLEWAGSSPVDWTSGTFTNVFSCNGTGASISVPLGFTISGGGTTATISYTETGGFLITQNFTGISCSAGLTLSSIDQTLQSNVYFGSTGFYDGHLAEW